MRVTLKHPDFNALVPARALAEVMRYTAEDAEDAIKEHYRKLPEDWFDSTRAAFPDGSPRHGSARTFMRALTQHWQAEDVGQDSFALSFRQARDDGSPWGLRMQEYGGVIRPKKARVLTIPLTAEARGMRAREFSDGRHRLFAVGKKSARGNKAGTLVWADEEGKLHAAYALRKSATIKPLIKRRRHHAIPTPWQLGRMVVPLFRAAVAEVLGPKSS